MEPDVIVAAGGHDQSCGALGVGVTKSQTAAYSIGTVECVTPFFELLKENWDYIPKYLQDIISESISKNIDWVHDFLKKYDIID